MKNSNKFFCLFFIFLSIMNPILNPIIMVNGIQEIYSSTGQTTESGFSDTYIVNNGNFFGNTFNYSRLSRINFHGFENGFQMFDKSEFIVNTSNSFEVIQTTDTFSNGSFFNTSMGYIPSREYVHLTLGMNDSSSVNLTEVGFVGTSVVFSIKSTNGTYDDFGGLDNKAMLIRTYMSSGTPDYFMAYLTYDQDINLFNINIFDGIGSIPTGGNLTLLDVNLNSPIFFSTNIYNDFAIVECGNVNGSITYLEWNHVNPPSHSLFNYTEVNYNNTSNFDYGGIHAIDFNYQSNHSTLYEFDYDETYYPRRIIDTYRVNDESFDLNDYNDYSLIDIDSINDASVANGSAYRISNISDSNDYKLNQFGNNKSGIIQWDEFINNTDVGNIVDSVNLSNHENILRMIDLNLQNSEVYYDFNNLSSGVVEYYVQTNNSAEQTLFQLKDDSSDILSIAIRFNDMDYYDSGWIEIYDGIQNNKFYHVRIDFDCSIDKFDCYVNDVLYVEGGNFQNSAGNISQLRLETYNSDYDYIAYFDSVGIGNDYINGSNKFIGNGSFTKEYNTFQLYNISTQFNYRFTERDDLFPDTWIDYNQFYGYYNESEITYSLIYTFGNPIFNDSYAIVSIGLGNPSELDSAFGMYLYSNGSVVFFSSYYDYYTNEEILYESSMYHNFFNQSNDIQNQLGIWIIEKNTESFTIKWFNSTNIYQYQLMRRLSFMFDVSLYSFQMDSLEIYGLIPTTHSNLYTALEGLDYLFNNLNYLVLFDETFTKTFTNPVLLAPYYFQYGYPYRITFVLTENTGQNWVESNYNYSGNLYSDYNSSILRVNTYGYYFTSQILSNKEIYNNRVYFDLDLRLYSEDLTDSFYFSSSFIIYWVIYYSETPSDFFGNLFSMFVPVLILAMFPISMYPKFGKKGSALGLIVGIVILLFAELLSLQYAIILIPIAIIIAYIIFKGKSNIIGVNQNG